MRIAWIINFVPRCLDSMERPGNSGWWIDALAEHVSQRAELTVYSCSPRHSQSKSVSCRGATYRAIPTPAKAMLGLDGGGFFKELAALLSQNRSDIVDVHGTEYALGLVAPHLAAPTVVTLQGFVHHVLRFKISGQSVKLGGRRFCAAPHRFIASAPLAAYTLFTEWTRSRTELKVLAANKFFFGRTQYDRSTVSALAPLAKAYYSVPRVLRGEFYRADWKPASLPRRSLLHFGRLLPYKGTLDLIEMIALLKTSGHPCSLRIGGGTHDTAWLEYLKQRVRRLGLSDLVSFIGALSAERACAELTQASLYLHPSHVDNSPNTLAEAMIVGVPCIASQVGGIPSMIDNGKTGLLAEPGDVQAWAANVTSLLAAPERARAIGQNATRSARALHSPNAVTAALLQAYNEILRTPSEAQVMSSQKAASK